MPIDLKKTSHILFFVVFLPALSVWLSQLTRYIPNINEWIDKPTTIVIYGILFFIFDKYIWSWPIFRLLKIVEIPDLRGRWKGRQISTFKKDGKNVVSSAVLEIRQTFSSINVKAFYEKSESHNEASYLTKSNDSQFLYYTYDNEPNALKEGTMQRHWGTARLEYLEKEKRLIGKYFNSIGNLGDVDFKFMSEKLINRYKA